jgi:hypothetical protein
MKAAGRAAGPRSIVAGTLESGSLRITFSCRTAEFLGNEGFAPIVSEPIYPDSNFPGYAGLIKNVFGLGIFQKGLGHV